MKFTFKKYLDPKDLPKVGDTRTLCRFAYLPVKIKDGFWIWFEHYDIIQEYVELTQTHECWVTIRKRIW